MPEELLNTSRSHYFSDEGPHSAHDDQYEHPIIARQQEALEFKQINHIKMMF